ncbi:MAG: hypothetical protein ACK5ME_07490, partial [Parahaliea sp.]
MALCLIVYWPGVDGPWLFDDRSNLLDNGELPVVAQHFDAWRTASLSSGSGILRRPVAMFSFAVDSWRAGELDAATVKRTNIVIHGLAALLLFFFLRSLLLALYERGEYGRQGAWRGCLVLGDTKTAELLALAAALFWLVHPLQVST